MSAPLMTEDDTEPPTWGFRIRRYHNGDMFADYITPSHMAAYRNELADNATVTIVTFDYTETNR